MAARRRGGKSADRLQGDPPPDLRPRITHLHLDLMGGLAGDMFAAAMLDLRPDLEAGLQSCLQRSGLLDGVSVRVVPHHDGILVGCRFLVERDDRAGASARRRRADHGEHAHTVWRDIRGEIEAATLDVEVKRHMTEIFALLAEAEAKVHGVAVEDVTFHEVGAWDSIADILAAAHLIAAVSPVRWTVGDIPLGSGRVRTAHGALPVPAPATCILLEGFRIIDDGIAGERVTPTGAAILAYLCRAPSPAPATQRLGRAGFGFGTRRLPGISNCVRLLSFTGADAFATGADIVAVIEFEIDDQSPEDLAMGLDRLRAHPGVHDVLQSPAFGKKGRMVTGVRVLVRPDALDEAIALCFDETTTIGLRHGLQRRALLSRDLVEVAVVGRRVRVKTVGRPSGPTAKAEANDVADLAGHARRTAARRAAEREREGEDT